MSSQVDTIDIQGIMTHQVYDEALGCAVYFYPLDI